MFEKPDIHAQIWNNQRTVHGPAKVKGCKILESCCVHIITFTSTQLILLVERKYLLTRFTLDQMLNAVMLKVKEESEIKIHRVRTSPSKQPFILEESPIDTMADQRTMAKLLRAPTEGYAEAIVVPPIPAEQFELKHSLINMMTSDQFFGLEKDSPHDHIRAARRWLKKEPPRSILTWEDLVSKFINEFFPLSRTTNLHNEILNFQQQFNESFHEARDRYNDLLRACPYYGFTELHQLDTFYNALNPADQDSLNSVAGGNLLERRTQFVLTIIENKSKQRIAVTTPMTAILKQFQATPPPAFVKAVEEICVTCGGAHSYYQCLAVGGNTFPELRDNIQGYVATAAVNYNQGNSIYRPLGELKSITTQSGIVLDETSVPIPPPFINPKEDECVEETLTDQDLAEVPLILERPFLRTARALIDVHGEEMILQSINLINVFNDSSEDFLENLFSTNHQSGNPTFSSQPILASLEVKDDAFNLEGGNVLPKKLLDLNSTKDFHPPHHINPLSGSATSSSSPNHLLVEFADELALIT
uniref:Retrotransposon gag domain-containing protein n=1 Tax=Tanacetum cinerariifolium TaxID=118510 RepID=A0A699IYJ1_TANCI|nr:hypothetical protein [Tanacetum cinerariifolium]